MKKNKILYILISLIFIFEAIFFNVYADDADDDIEVELYIKKIDIMIKLEKMVLIDQFYRVHVFSEKDKYIKAFIKKYGDIDEINTKKLKKIINKIGWPTISKISPEADHNAWLIVQHSSDLKFQKYCLSLIEEAVKTRDTKLSNYAYLKDRILLHEGKKQLFGTQCKRDKDGKLILCPIEDIENVNQRRKEYEVRPYDVNEYLEMCNNIGK